MRNVAKAQPAGYAAFHETAHMDEESAPVPANVTPLPPQGELGLPEWVFGNDLLALRSKLPPVLIGAGEGDEGGILRQRRKLVIGGSSKMGKTWVLADLAVAVASGGLWLGRYKCDKGCVLYVNLELSDDSAGYRFHRVGFVRGLLDEHHQLPQDIHANLGSWHLRGKCYDLSVMLAVARQRLPSLPDGLKLIIVDPLYKALGGRDENSAGEMGTLMLELEQFADECGASIAFAAHFSKGNQSGKEAIDRISGSGVIARDPDAILTFTPHEEENCYVLESSLREFAPLPSSVFEWSVPTLNPRADLDPAKLRQAGKAGLSKAPERAAWVRKALDAHDGAMKQRAALTAAIKMSGKMPDQTSIDTWKQCFGRHPQALADEGVEIVAAGNGRDALLRVISDEKRDSKEPF